LSPAGRRAKAGSQLESPHREGLGEGDQFDGEAIQVVAAGIRNSKPSESGSQRREPPRESESTTSRDVRKSSPQRLPAMPDSRVCGPQPAWMLSPSALTVCER